MTVPGGKYGRLVLERAADVLAAAGPGNLAQGDRPGRPRAMALRRWDELVAELRRMATKRRRG